jgi:hypothetical protein
MLGGLDDYFAGLYRAYFSKAIPFGPVDFKCDYRKLLRWLFKAFYNSARVRTHHVLVPALAKHVPFIRGLELEPPFPTTVFVGVFNESVATDRERQLGMPARFHPFVHKFGDLRFGGQRVNDAVIFGQMFSVNSYVFTVIVFSPGISDERRAEITKGMCRQNRLYVLPSDTGQIRIGEPIADARAYLMAPKRRSDLFLRKP